MIGADLWRNSITRVLILCFWRAVATMSSVTYLDHNATTPILPDVLDAMMPYLEEVYS